MHKWKEKEIGIQKSISKNIKSFIHYIWKNKYENNKQFNILLSV